MRNIERSILASISRKCYVPSDETLEVRKLIDENPCLECTIDYIFCDWDDDYFSISVEIKY